MNRYHNLSDQEKRIILQKGTEAPFSQDDASLGGAGIFICKQCDAPLFCSQSKFHSGCGWPSFDEAIQDHVRQTKDADGKRVEITCAKCHGHLGHVFYGEMFTRKNTRHCVNSLSMRFVSAYTSEGFERALVAGGCFWGIEYFMKDLKGVKKVTSGYTGGHVCHPTYQEVCSGLTGHVETCEVIFDPDIISYQKVLERFFEIHDFTQKNGQGPDLGSQYLSKIFVLSEKQKALAESLISQLKSKGYGVATQVVYGQLFYPAEDYHQNYYEKHAKTPYCHRLKKIF